MAPDTPRDEFELIARLFAPLARGWPGAYGLLDDAATIAPPAGHELVVTKDLIVEGVHYLPADPPDLVARKLIRVNVSDLAAKGAEPLAYLLGLALPRGVSMSWLEGFARGLAADQAAYGLHLIGGDTTSGEGPAVLSLTAFGTVPLGGMLRRAGARPGDHVYVSGTIGDAALGLVVLKGGLPGLGAAERGALIQRYRLPEPRPSLGPRLRGIVHACLDVSDGLIADLGHICEVSGVGAEIEVARLPLSPAARAALAHEPSLLETVLTGGDDYELLFTAPASVDDTIRQASSDAQVPVARIGRIVAGRGVRALGADGRPLAFGRAGYTHF
jgi:thiamine-monophosphate kinase